MGKEPEVYDNAVIRKIDEGMGWVEEDEKYRASFNYPGDFIWNEAVPTDIPVTIRGIEFRQISVIDNRQDVQVRDLQRAADRSNEVTDAH